MMAPLLVPDATRARASLFRLLRELSVLASAEPGAGLTDEESVERVWAALDAAVDDLHVVAVDPALDARSAGALLEARDAIASHLRAAAVIETTDRLPEVRTGLLVRAVERLIRVAPEFASPDDARG